MEFILSQKELILSYYKKRPNKDIPHQEVVDWATEEFKKRTGTVFRDPDRAIRYLHQAGLLIKVSKGVYRYDPKYSSEAKPKDFTANLKKKIMERDGYRCVICGKGEKDGVELHVDHIKPKDFGGEATIANGQTLCSPHNMYKKNYNQTETGKKMFITLLRAAKELNDLKTINFCMDVLKNYEKHDINGHIEWEK